MSRPKTGPKPASLPLDTPVQAEPAEPLELEDMAELAKAPPTVVSQLKVDSAARERLRNRLCAECLTPYPNPPAHSVGVSHEGRCPKCGSASFMVSVVS